MFNIGTGEFILIAVAALLILGPTRLPEFARGIGKFIREFRRQTDDVKNVVEREFYRMDEAISAEPAVQPNHDALGHDPHLGGDDSQLTAGALDGQPVALPAPEPVDAAAVQPISNNAAEALATAPAPTEPAAPPFSPEDPKA